ncbi:winged helix-turn-helix domain-containing protein [Helicobacter cholecystus]|uniref:winged helix-turn-helix domain-containing protein n=1 Tax=Helicobacter cholecystus TaxID=45498 RepID=UPI0027384E28|nr:LysR family transcriptional regulator [Helicobacter cholecystus]
MKIQARFWIDKDSKSYLGSGRITLLKFIQSEGSISGAAKKMRMSYKAAWDNLNQIKDLGGSPLIESNNGGVGGGGTSLTREGERAIEIFDHLQKVGRDFFDFFNGCENLEELEERLKKAQILIENFKKE